MDGFDPQVPGKVMSRAIRASGDRFPDGFDEEAGVLQRLGVGAERALIAGEHHAYVVAFNLRDPGPGVTGESILADLEADRR